MVKPERNVKSRQLVIGASLLQAFSLFMLSLAKPDQYYQVGIYLFRSSTTTNNIAGISFSGHRYGLR